MNQTETPTIDRITSGKYTIRFDQHPDAVAFIVYLPKPRKRAPLHMEMVLTGQRPTRDEALSAAEAWIAEQ